MGERVERCAAGYVIQPGEPCEQCGATVAGPCLLDAEDMQGLRDINADLAKENCAQRATIEAQEEAGRLANISTARAIERAEKAEAEVASLRNRVNAGDEFIIGKGLWQEYIDQFRQLARAALSSAK